MSFDATTMTVLGIPPYIFFAGIGFVISFLIFNCLVLKERGNQKHAMFVILVSLPALLLGAKLFGSLLNVADCIYYGKAITLDTFLVSGIVFYGGLIFFVISVLLWTCKKEKNERDIIVDSVAVAIPVFHMFGRIGCFTAGCCYGICNDGFFSVNYTTIVNDEKMTAQRVPIQLVEAVMEGILFMVLLYMAIKNINRGKLLNIYLLAYSVIRFINEFFRGDFDRNVWRWVTMAQVVSIIIFGVVIYKYIGERLRKVEQT